MFDVGFSEVVLIGVVALVVLGPERLPGAARTAGALLRRARNSWSNVKAEVERELAAEELKRSMRESTEGLDVRADLHAAKDEFKAVLDDVKRDVDKHDVDAPTTPAPVPAIEKPAPAGTALDDHRPS